MTNCVFLGWGGKPYLLLFPSSLYKNSDWKRVRMKAGYYFTASVLCVCLAYLTAQCGVSVLLVSISTSPPRVARWCLLGGGGAERSARGGDAFIPGLVLTAAAKASGKATREFVYTLHRMPLCFVHCSKLFSNMLEKEGTLPPPILLPSPDMIFTVSCSPLFKDKSMQNSHCLREASLESFKVVLIPLNATLFLPF